MKVWKVILAALVIFAAGVVTGGLTVRLNLQQPPTPAAPAGFGIMRQRGELLDRMQRQLYLNPTQRDHIEKIIRDSHEHMRQLWDSIAPQAQEERRHVHELIRAELNQDQQKLFDQMPMSRGPGRSMDDHRGGPSWRDRRGAMKSDGSNSSNSPAGPAAKAKQQ